MNDSSEKLVLFYRSLLVVIFVVLAVRFAQLQIHEGDTYFRESEKNRVRQVIVEPQRGIMYDRNGVVLVDNRPAYSVAVIPYEILNAQSSLKLLSSILEQEPDKLKSRIRKERIGNFTPVKIKRQIEFSALSHIEEYSLDLPGVVHNLEAKRFYPSGIKSPHIFGYLGEITGKELETWEAKGYGKGDLLGKSGLELQYEEELRGSPGVKYVEVDVLGREIRDLPDFPEKAVRPGNDIYLALDAEIQRYLETAMQDKRGAVIVLDARDGGVLAFLSKPDYDPETFSKPITSEVWNGLVNHPGRPLYNRACQSRYPPGSTYKLVLAAALLETGKVDLGSKIFCGGSYRFGRRDFHCWKRVGHGPVNFLEAIEQSCNVYFYTKVLDVGLETWSKFSRLFRFGEKTGIDLPREEPGLVPDGNYFNRKYGENGWTNGLLLNLAVGQGDLLTTPLQMAQFAMIVANNGTSHQPHLFEKYKNFSEANQERPEFKTGQIGEISQDTFEKIKEGMYRVVNGDMGTAKVCRLPNVEVCGKTGTAQNPHGNDHAWFIGFAPRENPRVALCVMVENGGGGGAVAAPIAAGVFKIFFKNQNLAVR
ncbi:penicillin-binding protein 2 [bacterium]|nr:penicillin-binding protein 2 [bacterium]